MLYISNKGEVMSRAQWEIELDKFWHIFESKQNQGDYGLRLPKRPPDAWARFAKLLGLKVYNKFTSKNHKHAL